MFDARGTPEVQTNDDLLDEQMTIMMEAMMSMRKIMEVNMATIITANTATEVDPTHPSGVNQASRPIPNMVGQGGEALGRTGDPYFV